MGWVKGWQSWLEKARICSPAKVRVVKSKPTRMRWVMCTEEEVEKKKEEEEGGDTVMG
jgi:hypothetical protein